MAVYRGMDIGTAKPSAQARASVPHHLLDLADPAEEFSLARFQEAARTALEALRARRARPLLVGGTGLYLRGLVDGLTLPGRWPSVAATLEAEADLPGGMAELYGRLCELDPLAASRIVPTNRRRLVRALEVTIGSGRRFSAFGPGLTAYPPTGVRLIGVRMPRGELDRRLEERIEAQMAAGWLEEVAALRSRRGGLSRTAAQALGYRELLAHLAGRCSLAEAVASTVRRTRAFARRQEAWFRRDPRITWIDGAQSSLREVLALLGDWAR